MTGREIKELRQSLRWSQMKLAEALGCHLSTIGKLEWKGEAQKVSPMLEQAVMRLVEKIEKG